MNQNRNQNESLRQCSEAVEALKRLKEGNARFVSGEALNLAHDAVRRDELATKGQRPYAFILTCSDSRVVPEFIFSAGLGELFVTRAAGNSILASAQYAAQDRGVRLFLVLGHSDCGGVKATLSGEALSGALAHMGQRIRAGIGTETVALRAVERNAKAEAADLAACLHEYCPELPLTVLSGVYDIRTGKVSFSEE